MGGEVGRTLAATWTIAETGIAGPVGFRIRILVGLTNRYCFAGSYLQRRGEQTGGKGHLVPGYCCFAVIGPVSKQTTYNSTTADREENMILFAKRALELLAEAIDEAPASEKARH